MPSPTAADVIGLAKETGFRERHPEASRTLFFEEIAPRKGAIPVLVNVHYTTRSVMTYLDHPEKGFNELWRSNAYDTAEELRRLFRDPRSHTGIGYRNRGKAVRGCSQCGEMRERGVFSPKQWRKGPDFNRCVDCVGNLSTGAASSSSSSVGGSIRGASQTKLEWDRNVGVLINDTRRFKMEEDGGDVGVPIEGMRRLKIQEDGGDVVVLIEGTRPLKIEKDDGGSGGSAQSPPLAAAETARECARCGETRNRRMFSSNQWRKGPDSSRCADCVSAGSIREDGERGGSSSVEGLIGDMLRTEQIINDVIDGIHLKKSEDESEGDGGSTVGPPPSLTAELLRRHDRRNPGSAAKSPQLRKLERRQFNCPDCPRYGRGKFVFFKKVPAGKPIVKCPQCKRSSRGGVREALSHSEGLRARIRSFQMQRVRGWVGFLQGRVGGETAVPFVR